MTKARVLVVDDEPNLADLVRFFLEKTKRFDVRTVNRSNKALAAAREFAPDVILLDVNMPGKDGGDVATEIESDSQLCGTPILFLTALLSHAETGGEMIIRNGMHFLPKPVDPRILVKAVDRLRKLAAIPA